MKLRTNLIVLIFAWVVILGVGIYFTFFRQPEEIEVLQKAEEVARMKNAELTSLQMQHVSLADVTEETLRKWHARYKIIPEQLSPTEVVDRLNELTASGFKNFDVSFGGMTRTSDYSYYTFSITGRGYYANLYRAIWELENGSALYRVRDLSLDHIDLLTEARENKAPRLDVMVSFTMRLEAYFDGVEGASAPADPAGALVDDDGIAPERLAELPPVPRELLPSRQPASNPFFPGIMQQIPPNTEGLVDVETATLVSIVGQKAVFQDPSGFRTVGIGERVYLGRIVSVDPSTGRVVAHLNKGGIYDEVELQLGGVQDYRRAQGPVQLQAGSR